MEPADLNSPGNDDVRLEAMLRRSPSTLPDDGFAARVLAALPATSKRSTSWRRMLFCVAGAGAGLAFALWQGVSWPDLKSGVGQFAATLVSAGPFLADPVVSAALAVTMFSLLVAFRTELRDKLMS